MARLDESRFLPFKLLARIAIRFKMNSSFSCDFTSINQFLANTEAGGVNITLAVERCSAVCSQAWGNGNPDLSGIGVGSQFSYPFGLHICR